MSGQPAARELGDAVARRLAEVASAAERLRSFAFEPGEAPGAEPGPDDRVEAARDFVLRALARCGDPVNFRIIRRLADGETGVAQLGSMTGEPSVTVWERTNDLLQVGLVGRGHRDDRIGLTPAGRAIFELVEEAARIAAEA